MRGRRAAAALLAAGLAACGGDEPGRVVGDVYVALETGEQVDVAATPVRLVDDLPEVDSALAALCARRAQELARLGAPSDSTRAARAQLEERAWDERARVLSGHVRASAVTSANARFALDSVAPGEYRLWADATVNGERWSWLHPVGVPSGDSLRVNLSNANADENPFRCRW
jgi:hypothetical protein